VSEEVNRNITVALQLSIPYTDPECHNAQLYGQTDRQTDDSIMPISNIILRTVRSAKKRLVQGQKVRKVSPEGTNKVKMI